MGKKLLLVSGILALSQVANAIWLMDPVRCAFDNLSQWDSPSQPIENTARGRNEWFKVCDPSHYEDIFPLGGEINPTNGRRIYPTFAKVTGLDGANLLFDPNVDGKPWTAPTSPPSSADDVHCKLPNGFRLIGFCTSGCVTTESIVETPKGSQEIVNMKQNNQSEVWVPLRNENGKFQMQSMSVEKYTSDIIPAAQKILVINTQSGASIRLSKNHPLLNNEFIMTEAEKFKVGDSLVNSNGELDEVIKIEEQDYFGKLYNLTVATNDLDKSLYVVQGFISGDKKYQDLESRDLNRKFFRNLVRQLN